MPATATEVLVELKRPPQAVFDPVTQGQANYFRFRLSPDVSISLGARAKLPGEAMAGERVELVVRQTQADEMKPYERLLGDSLRGDPTLFVREDGVEAAWNVVDPILGNTTPVHAYDPSTWGPTEANPIIAGDGGWHNPKPIADKAMEATK
jgi:glucose-6-phosphate 1-dehydrogenase